MGNELTHALAELTSIVTLYVKWGGALVMLGALRWAWGAWVAGYDATKPKDKR